MKTGRWMIGILALVPVAALSMFSQRASADDVDGAAPADAAATLEADGGADAGDAGEDADAGKTSPAFDATRFAEEKTPRPKDNEWKAAENVAFSPGSSMPGGCSAQRIREWIRVRCETDVASIGLIGGERTDVFAVLGLPVEEWQMFPPNGELVFPVRRGDRRMFEWLGVEFGYKGANSTVPLLAISEYWLPGDEGPTLISATP
jgi:hypothetical protein